MCGGGGGGGGLVDGCVCVGGGYLRPPIAL